MSVPTDIQYFNNISDILFLDLNIILENFILKRLFWDMIYVKRLGRVSFLSTREEMCNQNQKIVWIVVGEVTMTCLHIYAADHTALQ